MKPKLLLIPLFLLIWLSASQSQTLVVSAQTTLQWSTPRQIPGIADDSDPPFLVADQNRTVHAFVSQWILDANRNEYAVFYSQWSLERGWTSPIDILLSPEKHQAKVLGAFLDAQGTLHVIFYGGNAEGASLYYSKAPAAIASQSNAWSKPLLVGGRAASPSSGTLVGDANGNLVILYAGNAEGNGVYEVHSTDWGDTWTDPKKVFLTNSETLWVFGIQATMDARGQVHAIWDVDNKAGIAEAEYYARLGTDWQWSVPMVLQTTKECLYKTNMGSIIVFKNDLLVMYNCGAPTTRTFRISQDGGKTWTAPTRPIPLIGENGAPAFVTDSNNTLYAILANRTTDSITHGLWYSQWNGTTWAVPKPIVSGPRSASFDPSLPKAVMSQGNIILATWRNDPGPEMVPKVWFAYAKLDAPELPVVALPTPLPTLTATPSPTRLATRVVPTATPLVLPAITLTSSNTQAPVAQIDPNLSVLIPLLPVFLIVLVLVALRLRH